MLLQTYPRWVQHPEVITPRQSEGSPLLTVLHNLIQNRCGTVEVEKLHIGAVKPIIEAPGHRFYEPQAHVWVLG